MLLLLLCALRTKRHQSLNSGIFRQMKLWLKIAKFSLPYVYLGSAVAQQAQRWTCDKPIMGSNPTQGKAA